MHAAYTSAKSHQATHAPRERVLFIGTQFSIHTASRPPMAPYTLPPSLPHSLKRREPVKDAHRQHADRVAEKVEAPGNETRRQSALTHSTTTCLLCPSACTCMCPMHMRHAHARVHRGSLSLCICVYVYCVCVRARVRAWVYAYYIYRA